MKSKKLSVSLSVLKSINKLCEYTHADECRNFMEFMGDKKKDPKTHIFYHIDRIEKWIEKLDREGLLVYARL